ncbi:MAG TPA: M1 family aminopeptidase [Candidatus Sulfotelmatobacter sp.]
MKAPTHVTKVSSGPISLGVILAVCLFFVMGSAYAARASHVDGDQPEAHTPGPAESLYLQLSNVGLDPARVFRVREGSIDRPSIHISLDDGTIAFTQDVMGRITGAFFEGDGEVLLIPPNRVERSSMGLFTGMAILEERFSTAYIRFNDATADELRPSLREPDDAAAFLAHWNEMAKTLSPVDAMRLLGSFCDMLPVPPGSNSRPALSPRDDDHLLHARLQGNTLGVFDVFFDSLADEQVAAGQAKTADNGALFYDVWTSFTVAKARSKGSHEQIAQTLAENSGSHSDPIFPRSYLIDAHVQPPKQLDADVKLDLEVRHDSSRLLVFELSRYLKIQTVEADGHAIEFIQNPAIEGTHLARSGNDMVAVFLREPPQKGQNITLHFVYGGEVLAEAAKGLLYVGARGTWYPNRGLDMSDFDLTFHYPPGWTLVATGRSVPVPATPAANHGAMENIGDQVGRWISERPIPVAGFDLGKYVRAAVQVGDVEVETYATATVEKDFPAPPAPAEESLPGATPRREPAAPPIIVLPPSPARNAMMVSELAAQAVRYYTEQFGPFPYSKLALTQMPGRESQGWPSLVFLSSYAFLTPDESREIHITSALQLIDQQVPAHETAHQYWGDLIVWQSYRDQWFSEGLANYSSLMMLQGKNSEGFHQIMQKYRDELTDKDRNGNSPKDAGPVTLGSRLLCSHFPDGYQAISYGRGTWLFHMLRTMLDDASHNDERQNSGEPFIRGLRKLRDRYEGKAVTTREILDIFAEDLPPSLRYEGKSSLDWFLDGWINGVSIPKLSLHAVKFTEKAGGVSVTAVIRQEEADANLVTSVPIYAVSSGRTLVLLGRVFADGPESSFHLNAPAGTRRLVIDPYETILRSSK